MEKLAIKNIQERGATEVIRTKLLKHLNLFEKANWEIVGFQNMNMEKMHWQKPKKLSESAYYIIIEDFLGGKDILDPKKISPDGLVIYKGLEESMVSESIFFSLWLVDNENLCIVNYGEHKFPNEGLNKVLGRTEYLLTFKKLKNLLPILMKVIQKQKEAK